jgi:hypothetical protein
MTKSYREMTAAEKLADRIAKNREIDRRVNDSKRAASQPAEIAVKQKAVRNSLDEFQRIKKTQGIDAASDFVLDKRPK